MVFLEVIVGALVSLILSAGIISLTTHLIGEKGGFGTTIWVALAGTIYLMYFLT